MIRAKVIDEEKEIHFNCPNCPCTLYENVKKEQFEGILKCPSCKAQIKWWDDKIIPEKIYRGQPTNKRALTRSIFGTRPKPELTTSPPSRLHRGKC